MTTTTIRHETRTFASIPRGATDTLGASVRTCALCRADGDGARVAASVAVGSDGTFGACDRDGHERRAIRRAGASVRLVTLTTPDGTPLRLAWADED